MTQWKKLLIGVMQSGMNSVTMYFHSPTSLHKFKVTQSENPKLQMYTALNKWEV
jgi:hypothetical protein